KKAYMSSCISTNECADAEFLVCTSGQCACDPETAAYVRNQTKYEYHPDYDMVIHRDHNYYTQCAGQAGKSCLGGICVENSECVNEIKFVNAPSTITKYQTASGKCDPKKAYMSSCNSTNECNPYKFLSCVNGMCGCDPDISEYYQNPHFTYKSDTFYYSKDII